MSFPRYPAYKPSGVKWLGEVPEHWSIKQLKHCIYRLGSGGTPESGNPEYWSDIESQDSIPWVAIGDMSSTGVVRSTAKALSHAGLREKNLEVFPAGSLLYSIYASLGKVSILGVDAAFNQAILAILPNPKLVSQSYLKYWLESIERHLSYYSSSNTQANLNAAKVLSYPVVVPFADEQARIATFLDRETAKIDALIAEQQRLIKLLQEKRQAVISHAVTKGLNPDAPMKDSGVKWLGEVPEHWGVKPLKHLCEIYSGFPFRSDLFQSDGIPVVRMSNISSGTIDLQDAVCVPEHEVPPEALIRAGDLLLGLSGSVGNFGIATVGDLPAAVNQRVALIRTSNPLLKHFLGSPLFSNQVTCGLPSTTIANVSASQLGNCLLALPPLNEQEQIEKFLAGHESGSAGLTASVESSISLLQERRSALISAAVTGQIDVRGLVSEAEAP